MFQGCFVALITPFRDGEVDYDSLRELVDFQIANGTDGIVPVGTTGESPTLSHDEHKKVVETVVDQVAKRVPVIAGAGSNSTAEAIELAAHAKRVGADATLQVLPYYNKPTQEGLYLHFKAIADNVDLPVVLYNIPGRCAVNMESDTVVRLAEHKNIVAVKEATGKLDQASDIAGRCDLAILSGDDSLTLPMASVGGRGVVSVVANIVPGDTKKLTDAILANDYVTAREWHHKLYSMSKALLSMATNPIPIKSAMGLLKLAAPELRLPMTPLSAEQLEELKKILAAYGLMK